MRKFRCLECNNENAFTVGKIYKVTDNDFTNDNGFNYSDRPNDTVEGTIEFLREWYIFEEVFEEHKIQEVLYGKRTTIIKWSDGTQTEAVCAPEDNFDKRVGFAIAYTRKMNGGMLSE